MSRAAGRISDTELSQIEEHACPGAGACGGQFTANTMATAMEFLGISPAGMNEIPALDTKKPDAAYRAGQLVMDLLDQGVTPRSVITRASIENAVAK